ncbi:MAG: ATP-binding protein [Planctomycetota bacterium]
MIQLDLISGPNAGASFKVDEPSFIIGRGRANRIILLDGKVSARHAQIDRRGDAYRLRDLNSTNGTFVNGRVINEAALAQGDEVRVGQTVLQVAEVSAETVSRPSSVSISDAGRMGPAPVHERVERGAAPPVLEQPPEQSSMPTLIEAYRNLLAMYKVSGIIRNNADVDRLLHEVLDEIFRNFRAERGLIMLIDDETGELVPRAFLSRSDDPGEAEMSISRTIVDEVLEKQEAILTSDATLDERFNPAASIVQQHIRSAMCVPLSTRDQTLGIIYVDCRSDAVIFKKGDLELLTAIGNEAGVAVENRMLHEANLKAERLAAVGQTVAGLSHYIKNVLGCMEAGAEIVSRGLGDADIDSARKGWRIVGRNERKISELVLDMLNYSAERAPLRSPCDLNNVIEDLAESLGPVADAAGTRLTLELDRELPKALVDPTAMHRCMLNLLTNALDAVEGRDDAHITVSTGRAGGKAVIRVCDNGVGIPEDVMPKIFDVFVSTKGERGTGLGLAVVKKIINEHAGEITVESEPGQGAEFKLVLPINPTQA